MRYRLIWLAIGWLLLLLIAYVSLVPSPPTPLRFPHADKLEHLVAYALLMGWFGQLYPAPKARAVLALSLTAFGAGIELLQGWGGHRSAEWEDLLADAVGVMLGWLLLATSLQFLLIRLDTRLASHHDRYH